MKALELTTDALGQTRLISLELPFAHFGPTFDGAFAAPDPALATAYTEVTTLELADGDATSAIVDGRHLLFVVSGGIDVRATYMSATLSRGDVLLVSQPIPDGVLVARQDTRIVRLDLDDAWRPAGIVPPVVDEADCVAAAPILRRAVAIDGRAHLQPFDAQFAQGGRQPVARVSFFCLSPDSASDWHTEEPTTLVVVLSGGFELEVGGGDEQSRIFRAGDSCLVLDDHGQGHISRTHGETRFAGIVLSDPPAAWTTR